MRMGLNRDARECMCTRPATENGDRDRVVVEKRREAKGVVESVRGRRSPAFRINTPTAVASLGVRRVARLFLCLSYSFLPPLIFHFFFLLFFFFFFRAYVSKILQVRFLPSALYIAIFLGSLHSIFSSINC